MVLLWSGYDCQGGLWAHETLEEDPEDVGKDAGSKETEGWHDDA